MMQHQLTLASTKRISKLGSYLLGFLFLTVLATIWAAINSEPPSSDVATMTEFNATKMRQVSNNVKLKQTKAKLNLHSELVTKSQISAESIVIKQPTPRTFMSITQNMFSVQTWNPPLKKSQLKVRLPPTLAIAPPVPFIYLGQIEEDGRKEYFVTQQNKLINLEMGQVIHGQWRLDDEDVQQLYWTFLPLNLPQTLPKQTKQINLAVSRDVFATPE